MTANIVGTIAILPHSSREQRRNHRAADDSSLDSWLASLVSGPQAAGDDEPVLLRLVACTRLSRFSAMDDFSGAMIRADLVRLVDDLDAEYDRLVAI